MSSSNLKKNQGFWCHWGSKFALSRWLCTWALPQCSATALPMIQRCNASYVIERWSSKRKAPSELSLQQIGQWCHSWKDVYKYQFQCLALPSQTDVLGSLWSANSFDDLQLGDWTFCRRNGCEDGQNQCTVPQMR